MKKSFKVLMSVATASAVLMSSCGGGRSVDAFCSTLENEQERILEQLETNQANAQDLSAQGNDLAAAFTSLAGVGVALGDLATYFKSLSAVAPAEIQDDVEVVAEEYDKQLDDAGSAASNPLGAIGSGIVSGFKTAGPLQRVDSFARENCGQGI
ncbi:MAG: hypothetical protein HKN91_07515 [Acidimicrobiia bacterium]|nr:hypothetical protein [Acidimicrobiia bacterium]